jgi:DNA (cytosine-5)-methyltransferase 1
MTSYKFVDLFAGCGGLSLGLSLAGLRGQFAVERDPMAFKTFLANLGGERGVPVRAFDWPVWLEKKAWSIDELLSNHKKDLFALRGFIDVLAGGPPCQGYSFAGRREETDPRNLLFEKYVEVVTAIRPMALVLENVPGMRVAHKGAKSHAPENAPKSFYDKLVTSLQKAGYVVDAKLVDASLFGVPQKRSRLILLGVRKDLVSLLENGIARAFQLLEEARVAQLREFKLPPVVSAVEAISDLEVAGALLQPCRDPESTFGFIELNYKGPITRYQKLMRASCVRGRMDSMRIARHRKDVAKRFAKIISNCPKGVRMNDASRAKYGLKKHRIFPMSRTDPAPTITTLPDDVLHYSEPRILTVRECARLQSFPDWFEFRGKFTTGGDRRTKECPRYTQVGNAVPPFLGRAIGFAMRALLSEIATAKTALKCEPDRPKEMANA